MASIEETRQALQVERDRAMELAERSLSAIDSVTSLANFWLTGLSIVIALIALVGFGVVYLGATRAAKKVADNRLASYINSNEAVSVIRQGISEEVKFQIEAKSFVIVQPPSRHNGDGSFKKDTKGGQA